MSHIEAMKQWREALVCALSDDKPYIDRCKQAITSIDQAIADFEKQDQGEPVAWESVLGAVARGWCYEENANKTMDSDLAVAIAKEVHALYTTPQPKHEPAAWGMEHPDGDIIDVITPEEHAREEGGYRVALYREPKPKREPLTDE